MDEEIKVIDTNGSRSTGTQGYDTINTTNSEQRFHVITEEPSTSVQLKRFLFSSRLNLLYVCVPLAFIAKYWSFGDSAIFLLSFTALIPLAAILSDLTEDIALRTNTAIGALINVTFGNATEIIISIAALRTEKYAIITNTYLGSSLGNMLLVLGSSLLVAGYNNPLSTYNVHAAQIYMSSLILSSFAFLIPSAFSTLNAGAKDHPGLELQVSQELSVALLLVYFAFLYFQIRSHKGLFDDDGSLCPIINKDASKREKGHEEIPQFTLWFGIGATAVVAILISFLSDLLVDTMTPAADSLKLGFHFTSLVLVPIVGNVAEHASAIIMAKKGKMDIAFGVALGSSIQIAMFAMPFTVVMSFLMGKQLDLKLNPFLASTFFAAVVLTYIVVATGASTWLSGLKLLVAYLLLVMTFLRTPDE